MGTAREMGGGWDSRFINMVSLVVAKPGTPRGGFKHKYGFVFVPGKSILLFVLRVIHHFYDLRLFGTVTIGSYGRFFDRLAHMVSSYYSLL